MKLVRSRTHYRSLMSVENHKTREFYIKEVIFNNLRNRACDSQIIV